VFLAAIRTEWLVLAIPQGNQQVAVVHNVTAGPVVSPVTQISRIPKGAHSCLRSAGIEAGVQANGAAGCGKQLAELLCRAGYLEGSQILSFRQRQHSTQAAFGP